MHLHVFSDFYAFQIVFFATTYHLCIIHSRYFIFGFGAGHICLHIVIMLFNCILCRPSHHLYLKNPSVLI